MFSSRVHGGKAFAAEQKIIEFKKLYLKVNKHTRFNPKKLIRKVTANMNKNILRDMHMQMRKKPNCHADGSKWEKDCLPWWNV